MKEFNFEKLFKIDEKSAGVAEIIKWCERMGLPNEVKHDAVLTFFNSGGKSLRYAAACLYATALRHGYFIHPRTLQAVTDFTFRDIKGFVRKMGVKARKNTVEDWVRIIAGRLGLGEEVVSEALKHLSQLKDRTDLKVNHATAAGLIYLVIRLKNLKIPAEAVAASVGRISDTSVRLVSKKIAWRLGIPL